jgi:hypothetical protein
MIELQFTVPHRHQGDLEWDVVAALHVDGPHLEVDGDQSFPKCATSRCLTATPARA